MFTAASVMKLVGAGKFRLDDEIAPLVDPLLAKMAAKERCDSKCKTRKNIHIINI